MHLTLGCHSSAAFTALRKVSPSQVGLCHAGWGAFASLPPQPEQCCLTVPDRQVLSCSQDPQIWRLGCLLVPPLSQFTPVPSAICHSTVAFLWHGRQQCESHVLHLCEVLWLHSAVCVLSSAVFALKCSESISLAGGVMLGQEHLSHGGRKLLHMRPVG